MRGRIGFVMGAGLLLAWTEPLRADRPGPALPAAVDVDSDGSISFEEFRAFYERRAADRPRLRGASDEQLERRFRRLDTSGDGILSREEVEVVRERRRPQLGDRLGRPAPREEDAGSEEDEGDEEAASEAPHNPFGVMLGAKGLSIEKRIRVAQELGAASFRPNSVFMEGWNGRCEECEAARDAGFEIILTVRGTGGPRQPSGRPLDLAAYQRTLADILRTVKPALLAVENEENSALFYTGTAAEYLEELRAACAVAHEQEISCTNGGLVSALVALLVADDYRRSGDAQRADDFLRRALRPDQYAQRAKLNSSKTREQTAKGQALLAGYQDAGADYVNFHWYGADDEALAEAVGYLERASGLPALTNEVGQQRNEDPRQVERIMRKILGLELPVAVWFSVDVPMAGRARALTNPDGSLRPSGRAFKRVIESEF